jgi:response regulator RpfG family c-di-GMP phosphodiesterase
MKGRVLEAGVTDFLSLPLSGHEFALRASALAQAALSRKRYQSSSRIHEKEIRLTIGEIMLREAETLYVLGKAAEYKDRETGLHIARVAHYSQLVARVIGETAMNQDALFHASALHDIGKLGIPDDVLLKPGKLTGEEFTIMKTHAVIGHNILKDSQSSYLLTGALIALTHHEKFDGSGYPMGLQGEEIPLFGRIVGIADVFDALTTLRPYKEPWPLDRAFDLLSRERGRHFDPNLVDAFASNARGVEAIYHEHADDKVLTDESENAAGL